ncbi:hypothetical protein DL95DRAFT_96074 [Leptodontidium sp. 2 PMI_412]|nr:hypothetical protein DL95DRAFT_96074 [Leptodontidium sp. 2 PMI_412]
MGFHDFSMDMDRKTQLPLWIVTLMGIFGVGGDVLCAVGTGIVLVGLDIAMPARAYDFWVCIRHGWCFARQWCGILTLRLEGIIISARSTGIWTKGLGIIRRWWITENSIPKVLCVL